MTSHSWSPTLQHCFDEGLAGPDPFNAKHAVDPAQLSPQPVTNSVSQHGYGYPHDPYSSFDEVFGAYSDECQWGRPSYTHTTSTMPASGAATDTDREVNAQHTSVDSCGLSTLRNNGLVGALASEPTDARCSQVCGRLIQMIAEENIDPHIVITLMLVKGYLHKSRVLNILSIHGGTCHIPSRRRRALPRGNRKCSRCGVETTTQWRHHPETRVVLCNPCGQQAYKARTAAPG
ncbi:hypothetical protein R3P38DRAFT_2961702 [Favolaschia claudopus]|uniref:GATA-type domain-containing protein n=1 Tax=Favolaschia claudopus TaxID=2862362 RepID=A0AAW0BB07_9AGAR